MPFAHVRRSHSIDSALGRRLPDTILRQNPASKTSAQLSLEYLLQGTNHAPGSAQARSVLVPNTQARDAKPRLLLMGLRRYAFPSDSALESNSYN